MAVNVIGELKETHFVIMSDSCSVLRALSDIRNRHPVVRNLLHDIGSVSERNKEIEMGWIPNRIGIKGNEEAYLRVVRCSRKETRTVYSGYYRDWFPEIDHVIIEDCNREWESKKQNMYEVRRKIARWAIKDKVTRRKEVVVNRLRLWVL